MLSGFTDSCASMNVCKCACLCMCDVVASSTGILPRKLRWFWNDQVCQGNNDVKRFEHQNEKALYKSTLLLSLLLKLKESAENFYKSLSVVI